MNWESQDFTTGGEDVQAFTDIDSLSGHIEPDNFLVNKKKKAERQLRKAEAAISSGNTRKGQRILNRAQKNIGKYKKGDTSVLQAQLLDDQKKLTSVNDTTAANLQAVDRTKQSQLSAPKLIDPVTQSDAPQVQGSGATMTASGGGGGGGGEMAATPDQTATDKTATDGGTMEPVTVTNKKTNPLFIALAAFVLIGIVFFLKRKK